jgi:hypothetical protein
MVVMLYPRLSSQRHNSRLEPSLAKIIVSVSLDASLRSLLLSATPPGPSTDLNVSSLNRSKRHTEARREFPVIRVVREVRRPHLGLRSLYSLGCPSLRLSTTSSRTTPLSGTFFSYGDGILDEGVARRLAEVLSSPCVRTSLLDAVNKSKLLSTLAFKDKALQVPDKHRV